MKKGAQVILLTNKDTGKGLTNGSRGVVVDFIAVKEHHFPLVQFSSYGSNGVTLGPKIIITPEEFSVEVGETKVATLLQIPLKLVGDLSEK